VKPCGSMVAERERDRKCDLMCFALFNLPKAAEETFERGERERAREECVHERPAEVSTGSVRFSGIWSYTTTVGREAFFLLSKSASRSANFDVVLVCRDARQKRFLAFPKGPTGARVGGDLETSPETGEMLCCK
jgi:hypothetical protein